MTERRICWLVVGAMWLVTSFCAGRIFEMKKELEMLRELRIELCEARGGVECSTFRMTIRVDT